MNLASEGRAGLRLDLGQRPPFNTGMSAPLTITLSGETGEELLAEARSAGQTAEQFLAELLQRRATARRLREVQKALEPAARQAGWHSEEDILREVS